MPRNSVAEAAKTRATIIDRAVQVASVDGLEGVTIGRLATDLGMSKAGVIGQFENKEDLQAAALDAASEIFIREVWEPVAEREPGLGRLLALCDSWIAHVAGSAFAGGCFWTGASIEYDARRSALRDRVEDEMQRWRKTLRREVRAAVETGELPADTDPDQIAFELQGLVMGLNQALRLFGDKRAPTRARRAVRRLLGVTDR